MTLSKTAVGNKVICDINVTINGVVIGFTAGTWEQTAGTFTVLSNTQTIGADAAWVFSGSGSLNMAVAASIVVTGTLTVNTSGTFVMGSGNNSFTTVGTPTMNFTAGTITILGRMNLTLGTATINGANIIIDPQATNLLATSSNCFEVGAAANFTFSSGTVTIVDPLQAPASTGREIRFRLATTGVHSISGGSIYLGDGISTTSGAGFRISIDADFPALNNLVIQTGTAVDRAPTLSTNNTAINGTLTMISGVFTGSNIFNYGGSGTLVYAGSIAQTTSSVEFPAATSPNNLTINNSAGVTLHASRAVNGTLTLTNGKITLGANNLTVAALSGGSSSNYIVATGAGELRKTFTAIGSFTYPVGDASNYSPVTLNFTSGTFSSAYAGVKLANAKHSQNTSANDYLNRYWTVTSSGITDFSCNSTFNYVQSDVVNTESNLYAGKLNGSVWDIFGLVDIDANTLSGTVTSFSDFTAGEAAAMPVQLASFIGYFVNSNDVTFEWETISEIKNYGFWIQKYKPSVGVFETIEESFQKAKGEPATYTWTYANATIDNTEFYLLQQDLNGLETRFGPIMLNPTSVPVEAVPSVFALNQNYPNPFNPATVISWQLAVGNYTTLKVYNLLGNEVATLVNGYKAAGSHQVTFDGAKLSTGLYFYKLQSGNSVEVKKLTLVK
ncbi:MAG: T9SS type A sorting domain-containing protein [Bacteroidota bacterium]|nr:T9SS type A sorting domain-containing protein [Bacteroidota bacterium]